MALDGTETTALGVYGGPAMPLGPFEAFEEPQVYLFDFVVHLTDSIECTPGFVEPLAYEPAFEVI